MRSFLYIIIPVFLLSIVSCSKDTAPDSQVIKEMTINNLDFDKEIWEVGEFLFQQKDHRTLKGEKNIEKYCYTFEINYTIRLKEDCYLNKREPLTKNYFINKIRDAFIPEENIPAHRPGGCLTVNKVDVYMENLAEQTRAQIGEQYCQKSGLSFFGGGCVQYGNITKEMVEDFLIKEKEQRVKDLTLGKKLFKGHSKKLVTINTLCKYSNQDNWTIE